MYNEAVKAYMFKDKLVKQREEMLTRQLIRNAIKTQEAAAMPARERQPPKLITMQDISSERDKRFATFGGLSHVTDAYLLSG